MIEIEKIDVNGFEAAIRGMRNPMNSWDKSDSYYGAFEMFYIVGSGAKVQRRRHRSVEPLHFNIFAI